MPDQEMIERVAKAIFTKRYEADGTYKNLSWEDYSAKEFYLEDAKQAIKAMREPTDNMIEAGSCISTQMINDNKGNHEIDKAVWQAMIDSILK